MPTIAAVATALSPAGLGVIRVSGPDAVPLCDRVFRGKRPLSALQGYEAQYGHVFDAEGDIDDAVALVFRAPHSYTGEDTVELSCHGGTYILRRVLRAVIAAGARPAEGGEFTRRAFLNGKMDLSGAEAVMDLIAAEGKLAAKTALAAREGALYRRLSAVKDTLLSMSAQIAAFIDYPDDDVPPLPTETLITSLEEARGILSRLNATADAGRILRDGIDTAIVGAPNVGKSTLMNLLSGCERSIVTDIAGTTRDVVEETVLLGDVRLRLSDTAGLRNTADTVEAIGVQKARERMDAAALVLAVFDGSRPLDEEDLALLQSLKARLSLLIVNKQDLSPDIPAPLLESGLPLVPLSAKSGDGLERLREAVTELTGLAALTGDEPLLANERQRIGAFRCQQAIEAAIGALQSGLCEDAANVCIDEALTAVLELTGERTSDAVVGEVFRRFCVGK